MRRGCANVERDAGPHRLAGDRQARWSCQVSSFPRVMCKPCVINAFNFNRSVKFMPDANVVITASWDKTVRSLHFLPLHHYEPTFLAASLGHETTQRGRKYCAEWTNIRYGRQATSSGGC
jgi:hypothetical protein